MAVARTSSPNTWPHSLKVLFEVRMIEPLFVAVGDHLEDHVRLGAVEGLVADLVDHENGRPQVGAELVGQPAGGLGGLEVADHVVEAGEVDRVAGPAGRDRERDGDVRLAHSRRAEQGGVGLGLDEREGGEISDLARVELGLEGEVVARRASCGAAARDQRRRNRRSSRTAEFFGRGPGRGSRGSPSWPRQPAERTGSRCLGQVGQAQLAGRVADAGGDQLAQDDSFSLGLVVKGRVPVSSS